MLRNKVKTEKLEPQLVLNPFSKNYVNITPLWYVIQEHYGGNFKEFAECIDQIIRKISLEDHKEINREDEKNILYDLYNVKDILENLIEYQNK